MNRLIEVTGEVDLGNPVPLPILYPHGGWSPTCTRFSDHKHLPPIFPKFKGRQLAGSSAGWAGLQLGVLSGCAGLKRRRHVTLAQPLPGPALIEAMCGAGVRSVVSDPDGQDSDPWRAAGSPWMLGFL